MINRLKTWIRKKYLFWKYKHNYNTGKLIIIKKDDRRFGLTTMMILDCIQKGYMLYVPNEVSKRMVINLVRKNINLIEINLMNYLIAPVDVRNGALSGIKEKINIIVDNECKDKDIQLLIGQPVNIINGFCLCPYAA